jgi:uncharacterized membrane protein
MIFALLIAIFTCAAAWFLTGRSERRYIGALFGFADSVLWLAAGVTAGKVAVALVAAFCSFCFARPLLARRMLSISGRRHAQ